LTLQLYIEESTFLDFLIQSPSIKQNDLLNTWYT
jgi:hypothetical protein